MKILRAVLVAGMLLITAAAEAAIIDVAADDSAATLTVTVTHRMLRGRDDIVRAITIAVDDQTPQVQTFVVQRGPRQSATFAVEGLSQAEQVAVTVDLKRGAPLSQTFSLSERSGQSPAEESAAAAR